MFTDNASTAEFKQAYSGIFSGTDYEVDLDHINKLAKDTRNSYRLLYRISNSASSYRVILALIKSNPGITRRELVRLTPYTLNYVVKHLAALKMLGWIHTAKKGKEASYTLDLLGFKEYKIKLQQLEKLNPLKNKGLI